MHTPALFGLRSFVRIALRSIAFALVATGHEASAATERHAPEWRSFSDPTLGVQVDITAKTRVSYRIVGGVGVAITVSEKERTGEKIDEQGSRFHFEMQDFSRFPIPATNAYQEVAGNVRWDHSRERKIIADRLIRHQGLVWQEFVFSYPVANAGEPASARVIMGKHDDRIYIFTWSWNDAGPLPADAQRIFDSIRISKPTEDPNAFDRARLEDVIRNYWLSDGKVSHFTSAYQKRADQKRGADSKVIRGFGSIINAVFKGSADGWTVFRIEHENAVVDWRIADDQGLVTGLDWKKVRDL